MSADERKLEIALTALDEIHVVALPGTHAHDTAHAAMDRMSALPHPQPAPETVPPEALDIAWNALQHIAIHGDDKAAAKARETLRAINEFLEDGTTEDGIDRTPRAEPAQEPHAALRMILGPCPVHAGTAHAQIGDDDEWFCLRDLADTAEAVGGGEPGTYAPLPGPAAATVPEGGMLALRPLLSATVAVAAGGGHRRRQEGVHAGLALIDVEVAQITPEHIEKRLRETLRRVAGEAPDV